LILLYLIRWDWVVILFVLYTGIITPYTISFPSDEDQKRTGVHVLVILDVLIDFMFIFDILISFR